MYDARQIAGWFVDRAKSEGKTLSIMSLLKLTYIAHGWHLEMRNRPLFPNPIQAWKYGPVIPDVYNEFRHNGINVNIPSGSNSGVIQPDDASLLEEIFKIYGNLEPFQLSDITHVDGGPWDIATKAGGYYAQIPNELIRQHYVAKRNEYNSSVGNG